MVLSCKSGRLNVALSGLNPSQHVALLTQQLFHCLTHNALLQVRGSLLSLGLITLELEKLCPDWLALTVDLLHKLQVRTDEVHWLQIVFEYIMMYDSFQLNSSGMSNVSETCPYGPTR